MVFCVRSKLSLKKLTYSLIKGRQIKILLDFVGSGGDIADPWYSGDFTATYEDITKGCLAIIDKYKEGKLCQ